MDIFGLKVSEGNDEGEEKEEVDVS